MMTLLLILIYIAFISLGLPDSIMGSAWPLIHVDLGVSVDIVGVFTMIVSGGTIVSSLMSEKLIRRFGTGKVTAVSVGLTAIALLGIYFAPSFAWICLLGIPLGIGAGAVDAALNNFVALHYSARHMNWLHCFWGIGATAGPVIMSGFLGADNGWRMGYLVIGIIQASLVLLLIISLPLWKAPLQNLPLENQDEESEDKKEEVKGATGIAGLLSLKGAKSTLIAFFCYCAIESTTGIWGSTYLVFYQGVSPKMAAGWISTYYLGITVGRFLSGVISSRLNNRKLIRLGQILIAVGIVSLLLPFSVYIQMVGLILIGLGCAPIYPAMLHETPVKFGKNRSQEIMGIQMAFAYVGSTFMPPLFGLIGNNMGFFLFIPYILIICVIMIVMSEITGRACYQKA